jgi:hypothetical protein
MLRAITLSAVLLLATCLLSGCYVYHQEDGEPYDQTQAPVQQQQQQVSPKGGY